MSSDERWAKATAAVEQIEEVESVRRDPSGAQADLAALRRAAVRITGSDVDADLSVILAGLALLPSFEDRVALAKVDRVQAIEKLLAKQGITVCLGQEAARALIAAADATNTVVVDLREKLQDATEDVAKLNIAFGVRAGEEARLKEEIGRLTASLANAQGEIERLNRSGENLKHLAAAAINTGEETAKHLSLAHDAAHKLYQAAEACAWGHNDSTLPARLLALRAALDPAKQEACAREVTRRDGLEEENARLRREVGVHKGEASKLRTSLAAHQAAFAAEVERHKTTLDDRDAARARERGAHDAARGLREAATTFRTAHVRPDGSPGDVLWHEPFAALCAALDTSETTTKGAPVVSPQGADASLEARAKGAREAYHASLDERLLPAYDQLPKDVKECWRRTVRAVDTSRPGLTEEEARAWADGILLGAEMPHETKEVVRFGIKLALLCASRGDAPRARPVAPPKRPRDLKERLIPVVQARMPVDPSKSPGEPDPHTHPLDPADRAKGFVAAWKDDAPNTMIAPAEKPEKTPGYLSKDFERYYRDNVVNNPEVRQQVRELTEEDARGKTSLKGRLATVVCPGCKAPLSVCKCPKDGGAS